MYPSEEHFFDFLPNHSNNFDDHWTGASSSQRAEAKEKVAKQFLAPIRNMIEEGGRLLDVGCGDGVHIKLIAGTGNKTQLYGLDMSVTALRNASEIHGSWNAVHADAQHLPFHDRTFDIVISFGVLAYLENPREGLAEISRVVRSGGMIGLWIAPPTKGFAQFMLRLTRSIATRLPLFFQKRLADFIVPFLTFLPTVSKLDLRTGTWRECREVVLVNIAPPRLAFPKKETVESWLISVDFEPIHRIGAIPGEYWARKN
ncbi:ubiquinone/menaquinone biosynthesis C-methylase UbiE [Rhizobium aquaticum]|uniref:Ubiquinone/menaquinone biosynthesis C-methylase UbiE n=1 Tax=Rhizobium aquaticum TaxID=1549636 RepID=A0ABV2J2R4_9HYPH